MTDERPPPPPPEAGADEEALYDRYLEACIAGEAPPPEAFFAEHPQLSPAMRERIASVFALRGAPTQGGGPGALPFERIGGYRLLRRLGVGGMGTVYLAEQESLGRRVALKVIRSELRDSDLAMRRFEREAQAVARLRHPAIVTVHEFGSEGAVRYIAMELVRGRPLDEVLREAPPEVSTILGWGITLARALGYAHEQGVVHRDVKPQNVMITPEGRPVLLDFGVAHVMGTQVTRLTEEFAGSPMYAAPEQLTEVGEGLDGRTDVYALGITLYEALTGAPPFEGGRIDEVILRVLKDEPRPPRALRPDLSADVETVLLKALEKRRARRYATAFAFADDLERACGDRPVAARRPGALVRVAKWARRHPAWAGVAAVALLVALASALLLVKGELDDRARARELVAEAGTLVDELRSARLKAIERDEQVEILKRTLTTRWVPHETDRAYEELLDRVSAERQRREQLLFAVLERLARAQRLHAQVEGVDRVRMRLFTERAEDARVRGESALALYYRRQVEALDPEGRQTAGLRARGLVHVASEPTGAEVYLFRFEEQRRLVEGGERRLVSVPHARPGAPLPAPLLERRFALRIVRGGGGLAPGDLIVEVAGHPVLDAVLAAEDGRRIRRGDRLVALDEERARSLFQVDPPRLEGHRRLRFARAAGGSYEVLIGDLDVPLTDARGLAEAGGVEARVWRLGALETMRLPAGLVLRPTAAPRWLTPGCRLGRTPLAAPLSLEVGEYVAVFRLAEHEELVWPFTVGRGRARRLDAHLLPAGTTPPGFVHVPGPHPDEDPEASAFERHAFWIMEREVSRGEYAEYLRARLADPDDPPPSAEVTGPRGVYKRLPDRRIIVRPALDPSEPVAGLAYRSAEAYARWLSAKEGRWYALPTEKEYQRALAPRRGPYVYGASFRPKWSNTNLSHPGRPSYLEPPFRYPIDEAPLGLFDVTGNVGEWLDHWWSDPSLLRKQWTGGSAAHGRPEVFGILAGNGMAMDQAVQWVGVRLVLRRGPPPEQAR